MLHIGRWMEQETAGSFSKPGGSLLDINAAGLLAMSIDTVGWLGDQLLAGWSGSSQGDGAPAAHQTVLLEILMQHVRLRSALDAAVQQLFTQPVSGDASSGVVSVDTELQQQVVGCCKQLQEFAAAVIDEFPVSSSWQPRLPGHDQVERVETGGRQEVC
jgi:hypothetical protein